MPLRDEDYLFAFAGPEDREEIYALMESVAAGVEDPDLFVLDPRDKVYHCLSSSGFGVTARTPDGTLAGSFVARCPGGDEDNLGHDIGLSGDALQHSVHMDSIVVAPEHRGHGLQRRLLTFSEEKLRSEDMVYLIGTASPFNAASCRSFEGAGYRLLRTKEKYGGFLRRIYYKYIGTGEDPVGTFLDPPLRSAVFDMDGLLFDTETLFIRSFVEYLGPLQGMPYSADRLKRIIGLNRVGSREKYRELYGTVYMWDECKELSVAWMYDQIERYGMPVKEGARELLAFLEEKEIPCALATSSGRDVADHYLSRSGLTGVFSVIVSGDEVSRGKPDPEIFFRAADRLGSFRPEECAVFEDSPRGIEAGLAGGFSVVAVPDIAEVPDELLQRCYGWCRDLRQAVTLLAPRLPNS